MGLWVSVLFKMDPYSFTRLSCRLLWQCFLYLFKEKVNEMSQKVEIKIPKKAYDLLRLESDSSCDLCKIILDETRPPPAYLEQEKRSSP